MCMSFFWHPGIPTSIGTCNLNQGRCKTEQVSLVWALSQSCTPLTCIACNRSMTVLPNQIPSLSSSALNLLKANHRHSIRLFNSCCWKTIKFECLPNQFMCTSQYESSSACTLFAFAVNKKAVQMNVTRWMQCTVGQAWVSCMENLCCTGS